MKEDSEVRKSRRRSSIGTIHVWVSLLLVSTVIGCTSAPSALRSNRNAIPKTDLNRARIDRVLNWLDYASLAARNLYAEGELTASDDVTSQDGHFTLRSKRLDPSSTKKSSMRMDSLSVEISGPFGISVAKFLACPQQYYFYNILNGDSFHGPTDVHSLEGLTQMKGLTLAMLNDALFGLAPGADMTNPQDSIELLSEGDQDLILVVRHPLTNTTDAIYLTGTIPPDSIAMKEADLSITKYQRWDGILDHIAPNPPQPSVTIKYEAQTNHDGIQLPSEIETIAGKNQLTIEYSKVKANSDVTVKIKLPRS
jgi:hypothetical protein